MIYLLQSGPRGPIKIGYTRDIDSFTGRFQTLQCGNPETLVIRGIIPTGDLRLEKRLQWKFRYDHVRGEWFAPSKMMLEFCQLCNGGALEMHESAQSQHGKPMRALCHGGVSRKAVMSFLSSWTFGGREVVEGFPVDYKASKSFCPACDEPLIAGEAARKVGCVTVHDACADDPPPERAFSEPKPKRERKEKRPKTRVTGRAQELRENRERARKLAEAA